MSAARPADDGDQPEVEPIFDELLSRALARIRGQHQIRETARAEGMAPAGPATHPPAPIGPRGTSDGRTWHARRLLTRPSCAVCGTGGERHADAEAELYIPSRLNTKNPRIRREDEREPPPGAPRPARLPAGADPGVVRRRWPDPAGGSAGRLRGRRAGPVAGAADPRRS